SSDAALPDAPDEIFLYPLYVRPLTGLARLPAAMALPDIRLALYRAGRERLLAAGFTQVDMRYFRRARPGTADRASHHVMTDGTLGLGCGARPRTPRRHHSRENAVRPAGGEGRPAPPPGGPARRVGFRAF